MFAKLLDEVQKMQTAEKCEIQMKHRKEELKKIIGVCYAQSDWNEKGIPKVETIKKIGLWNYLSDEAKTKVAAMNQ